jgi:hypothetical protein
MNEKSCPKCGYELSASASAQPRCLTCDWSPAQTDCKVCRFSMVAVVAGLGLAVAAWHLWPATGESQAQQPRWTPAPPVETLRSIDVRLSPPLVEDAETEHTP